MCPLIPSKSRSNLDRFIQCVTPVASSRVLPQSCVNELNSQWLRPRRSSERVEYFTLRDLWDCYCEWSAYGAGTELVVDGGTITQYYVPYLSAIQIFSNKSVAVARFDTADAESDSWSDDSLSDKLSRSLSNNSSRAWDSSSDDPAYDHNDKLGCLYMQYNETSTPYWRVPFSEKIAELAKAYPGLYTLKNVDLSPASWMAVAWYPIYHIPSRRNEKDLSTCFLTYHTLSSSFLEEEEIRGSEKGVGLPPFGLVTYKMHGDIWLDPETSDLDRLMCMNSAADSWLKQLSVLHHDFNFFNFHSFL